MIKARELIKKQDIVLKEIISKQCVDEESMWHGGYNPAYDVERGSIITTGLSQYADSESKFYKSEDLLKRMNWNMDFLLRFQLKSGLVSLMDCNIESPPDTAFIINNLAICHYFIKKVNMDELYELDEKIITFLDKTQNGMITGGFHTPNHRWVMSCALVFLYDIFGNEQLKNRALEYLDEGIDNNVDGEWTERSNAAYNSVCDLCMYHIGEILNNELAFSAARRNLEMMTYMIHPNESIVTEYSTRQDRGNIILMGGGYVLIYFLMAAKDMNSEFMYMANLALKNCKNYGMILLYAKIYENLFSKEIPLKKINENYVKLLNKNNQAKVPQRYSRYGNPVLRYRKDKMSLTVMSGQPNFLYFQYGNARMFGMRFVVGWFGLGGVSFSSIDQLEENKYRLYAEISGKYWQTLKKEKCEKFSGDFNKMPNHEREDIGKVKFSVECIVTIVENEIALEFSVDCQYMLFAQIVCMFDSNGNLEGNDITQMGNNVIRQNSATTVYICDGSEMEIYGGGKEHDFAVIRGDSINHNAKNLVFNFISPKKQKIIIKTK